MKDRVFIEDLKIETIIGIFGWEREVKQEVNISLEMEFNIDKALETDFKESSFRAFLLKNLYRINKDELGFKIGKGIILNPGTDVTIAATGHLVLIYVVE